LDDSCYYSLGETFIEKRYTLIGKNSQAGLAGCGLLHRGHYLLPFRLALPVNIPSSFHFQNYGLHGRIIYFLEVDVSVPGILKKNLKSEAVEVTIRQLTKYAIMPMQIVDELALQSFWCTAGAFAELAVALDKNVYAPGDRISLKFALSSSSSKIKNVQILLVRHIRIGTEDRCRREEKLLGRVNTGRISSCIERRTIFTIPEGEPFSVQGKMIECYYELKFKIKANWCYANIFNHRIIVNDSLLPSYSQLN
jgi:hypothetical protein